MMIDTISELLDFPVSLERTVDAKQEWKEIQTSNKMAFVKLHDIRDRKWIARHKALFFKGEFSEWEGMEKDNILSGYNTYSFCLPLFATWYHHENGDGLLDAVRRFVIKHDRDLFQVKKGRSLIYKTTQGFYYDRPYGFFGTATPAIVKLFFEGELSDAYEKNAEPYGWMLLTLYLASVSAGFHYVNPGMQWEAGASWYPGRFMRERALAALHDPFVYRNDRVVSVAGRINEKWKTTLRDDWNASWFSPEAVALKEKTERQLREDIQSGALSGWVADIITDGIEV